jgi:hypothetical protein
LLNTLVVHDLIMKNNAAAIRYFGTTKTTPDMCGETCQAYGKCFASSKFSPQYYKPFWRDRCVGRKDGAVRGIPAENVDSHRKIPCNASEYNT